MNDPYCSYEIPDSHQLLERVSKSLPRFFKLCLVQQQLSLIIIDPTYLNIQMDRREPDDPSPYLLAIWTPGKTNLAGSFTMNANMVPKEHLMIYLR